MQFKWLFNLVGLGVNLEARNDIGRRVGFSNIVFLTLPVVYIIFMLFDLGSYLQPLQDLRFDQFIVPIVIGVCVFCLWLNRVNFTTTSRLLFIISWPILLHFIPIQIL